MISAEGRTRLAQGWASFGNWDEDVDGPDIAALRWQGWRTTSGEMGVRQILYYPDNRLRTPGEPVTDFGPSLQVLVDDMAETMYSAPGLGLAAPQIGVSLRGFIIDTATNDDAPSDLRVFVNPELLSLDNPVIFDEGCLSFPGAREEIDRFESVTVRARDARGNVFDLRAEGLLAIAIQHENDHLDGKLMIDYLGVLRRRMLHRAMMKRAASEARP